MNYVMRATLKVMLIMAVTLSVSCNKLVDRQHGQLPRDIFEELWQTVDRRYALFPVKDVNWAEVHDLYARRISDDLDDQQLFGELSGMLDLLKDGHVTLTWGDRKSTYDAFYTAYPPNFNWSNIVHNYLPSDYRKTGPIVYAIANDVGYLYYGSFRDNVTRQQLDTIFDFLKSTKGLIVDVRGNLGGSEQNVDYLYERFSSARSLLKYEQRRLGARHDDFSKPEATYSTDFSGAYTSPVCVLANRSSFSASNDFVLYMKQRQNTRLVGDSTGGGGGIPANYLLANGWKLQYTATMTLSPARQSIESGFAPDVFVNISLLEDELGHDPILEKAFELLR